MFFRLEVKCYLLQMIGSLLLKICSRSVKISPYHRYFECKSMIIFSSCSLYDQGSKLVLVFMSVSGCRASGTFDISSEN